MENDLTSLKREMSTLREQMINQEKKMDEMENRMRRKNVRIVGLPEHSEGADPVAFLEKWFSDALGQDSFTPFFAIKRAHRAPIMPHPPTWSR